MTMIQNSVPRSLVYAILSVMLSSASLLAKQPAKTIEYKFPWGIDRVTFDPSRVPVAELNRWMELSPILGNYNFMIIPEVLELCKSEDPRYHCEAEEGKWNASNAQLNLDAIADRIKRLSPENYPHELAGVVTHLRKLQSTHLWIEQQKLTFLKTNDVAVLENKYGEIDPQEVCKNVIQQIRATSDLVLRSQLARFDWYNCVLAPTQKELGPYPLDQWNSFLRAYGIQEKRVDEEIDD